MTTEPEVDAVGLLPCPFCGHEAGGVPQNSDQPLTGRGWRQFIWCENCNTEGPLCETEAEAIERWNRRVQPDTRAVLRGAGAPEAFDALDVADRLIERAYGDQIPPEWNEAYRKVARAHAAPPAIKENDNGQ